MYILKSIRYPLWLLELFFHSSMLYNVVCSMYMYILLLNRISTMELSLKKIIIQIYLLKMLLKWIFFRHLYIQIKTNSVEIKQIFFLYKNIKLGALTQIHSKIKNSSWVLKIWNHRSILVRTQGKNKIIFKDYILLKTNI